MPRYVTPSVRPATQKPPLGPHNLDLGLLPVPAAVYLFDNGTGSSTDYAGRGGPLVQHANPPWTSDYGGQLAFNGTTQYLSGSGLDLSGGAFSISFLSIPGSQSIDRVVFAMGTVGSADQQVHILYGASSAGASFRMWSDDLDIGAPPAGMSDTGLYRVTCTLDANKLQTGYIFDSAGGLKSASRTAGGFFSGNTTMTVGQFGSGGNFFAGKLMDLFVWKGVALTAGQVRLHNAEPYAMFQTRPMQRWVVVATAAATAHVRLRTLMGAGV